jgi:predicted NBD/HSP70 family sugar kinase
MNAGRWLSRALGDDINLVGPERVTVGGGVLQASFAIDRGDPYFRGLFKGVKETAYHRALSSAELCRARLGMAAALCGAASLAEQIE